MMVMATLAMDGGMPGPLALVIGVGLATLAGMLNGLLVTRVNLPPFIVTLGTLSVFTAIALLYSGGSSIQQSHLPDFINILGKGFSIGGFRLTYGVLLVIVMYAVVGFVLGGADRGAKGLAVLGRGGVKVGDGDGDVVQAADHGGQLREGHGHRNVQRLSGSRRAGAKRFAAAVCATFLTRDSPKATQMTPKGPTWRRTR